MGQLWVSRAVCLLGPLPRSCPDHPLSLGTGRGPWRVWTLVGTRGCVCVSTPWISTEVRATQKGSPMLCSSSGSFSGSGILE